MFLLFGYQSLVCISRFYVLMNVSSTQEKFEKGWKRDKIFVRFLLVNRKIRMIYTSDILRLYLFYTHFDVSKSSRKNGNNFRFRHLDHFLVDLCRDIPARDRLHNSKGKETCWEGFR
jgi:hypothetical protein